MNGLKTKYSEDLQFEIVPTNTERGKTEPKEYGLGRHGMVILDQKNNILWKKKGHRMNKEDVRSGIQTALAKVDKK